MSIIRLLSNAAGRPSAARDDRVSCIQHEDKFELLSYRTTRSKLLQELPMTAEWEQYTTSSG